MKNKIKGFLGTTLLLVLHSLVYSQKICYFKDFDFFKMNGIDTIKDMGTPPNFYVKCVYDNANNLVEIISAEKFDWMGYYLNKSINIIKKEGVSLLFLGAGKQRTGYTRALFQSKQFISDSAIIYHDTLIFKTTRKNNIRIQFFTNINSDSIIFKEMSFSFDKKNKIINSPLTSFENYKDWFKFDIIAYRIVGGDIKLKKDTIMIWKNIKPTDYSGLIDITKNDFKDTSIMPITLFWLKTIGLLY